VQVHYDEGIANRIGPESCAGAREGVGEVLTGVCIGQPSSRESDLFSGADAVQKAEGNTDGRVNASARTTRRGRRPWHVQKLLVFRNREISRSTNSHVTRAALVRIGKARSCSR
jgi:hypothetical protein